MVYTSKNDRVWVCTLPFSFWLLDVKTKDVLGKRVSVWFGPIYVSVRRSK